MHAGDSRPDREPKPGDPIRDPSPNKRKHDPDPSHDIKPTKTDKSRDHKQRKDTPRSL
jgi:hypothetical protein